MRDSDVISHFVHSSLQQSLLSAHNTSARVGTLKEGASPQTNGRRTGTTATFDTASRSKRIAWHDTKTVLFTAYTGAASTKFVVSSTSRLLLGAPAEERQGALGGPGAVGALEPVPEEEFHDTQV